MRHPFIADLHLYHQLRFEGATPTQLSLLLVAISSPSLWQLQIHRFMQSLIAHCRRAPKYNFVWRPVLFLTGMFETIAKIINKSELLELTQLEGGVYLSNRGGIMLGARRIGSGCLIHHGSTIGVNPPNRGTPEIGRNVWVGPDSIISGLITVGEGATILPGTVLTKSIPARAVVQGNPARIVARDFDNVALRASLTTNVATLFDPSYIGNIRCS